MKKIIGFILLIISIAMIVKGSMLLLENKSYLVKFTNEESFSEFEIVEGGYIQIPDEPIKEGYKFVGWEINGEVYNDSAITLTLEQEVMIKPVWEKTN